ncbi:MAG: hypothetical protein JWO82_3108 [Akkermansiaceae bacterium]|nr:hypothetical protein [Akkermansiaceae bacterium]
MTAREYGRFLYHELSPSPYRARTTARLTLGALLVITVMLAFKMPLLSIGPYLLFLGVQRDGFFSRVAIFAFFLVFLIVSGLLTGLTFAAWDDPWLRLPLTGLLFYGGFYLIRTFAEPRLVTGPLTILSLVTYLYDQIPNPNLIFDQIGWLWAIFGLMAVTMLLMQWIIPPPSLYRLSRLDMRAYLVSAERKLIQRAFVRPAAFPGEGFALERLLGTLKKATGSKDLSARQGKNCRDLASGVEALVQVAASPSGAAGRPLLLSAARRVRQLRFQILWPERWRGAPSPSVPSVSETAPLQKSLHELDLILERARTDTTPLPKAAVRLVPEDFTTNPEYHRFALRGTLATLFCYLFMTAAHWDGIHTCMVTCIITALASAEARTRKQQLRIAGAVLGGICAFACAIFVVPHVHDFTGFLLLIGAGTFIGAWITHGNERYSYIGLQFTLALYLMLLQSTHAVTKLQPTRDRWAGILLGTLVMWAAFARPGRKAIVEPGDEGGLSHRESAPG